VKFHRETYVQVCCTSLPRAMDVSEHAFRPSARACYPLARGSAHKTTVTFVGRSIGAILLRCRRRSERLSKYELVWRSIFMVQPAWRPSCIIRGRAVLGGR
jgi:hypothetical protein